MSIIRLLVISLILAATGACGPEDSHEPQPATGRTSVRLALNWFPEAEHGGFYAALVHGLYERAGLEVEILGGGPDAPVIQRVATGAVEFGISNADGVLNGRAAAADVIAIMAPYQINPRCIMVHAATGIERIADLADLTLSLSQRPAFSQFLRWRYDLKTVTLVPYHGGITAFLLDQRHAQQAYLFSEPVLARRQGAQPRALLVADTGFNPYASALIATGTTIATRPEVVRAMVQASVDGWHRYLEDPGPTNRHINALNPEMDLEILAEGARQSRALVLDDVSKGLGLGVMSLERWDVLRVQMEQSGVLGPGLVQAEEAFSNAFLQPPPAEPGR